MLIVVVCAVVWMLAAILLSLLLGAVLGRADQRQRELAASSWDFPWIVRADKIIR